MIPEDKIGFGDEERLSLHQLHLLEWAANQVDAGDEDVSRSEEIDDKASLVPNKWCLTEGVQLYAWQKECIEGWFGNEYRGTVKVVTGGGKTLLGLAIAERLQQTVNKNLRVAVVVPTVVLMHQWYDEMLERGNLPPSAIARLGGGYKEDLKDGSRVIIVVLASARKQLAKIVRSSRNGKRLLLIADECHRAGAAMMSDIFDTQRAYSLGLSATPEREDEDYNKGYDESLLGKELGPIIYDFTLAQALELEIIPPFAIRHYGLPLNSKEQSQYDQVSRSISDTQSELRAFAPPGKTSGPGFFQWLHGAAGQDGQAGSLAAKFMSDIRRRQSILLGMESRGKAVEEVLQCEFGENPDARAILFHESIDEVMKLYIRLRKAGFRVIAEHSQLPDSLREEGLNLFRKGVAQVIVSARSLIEGFNVPAVDVGIIVASNQSVRQRIQSLGRVLRRHRTASGEEKTSAMHVFYARGTVDDQIYAKLDWDGATGIEQNFYYHWDPPAEPIAQDGPPRKPLPTDLEIDAEKLKMGDTYPGAYEGNEYTCDTQGNIQDGEGRFAFDSGDLVAKVVETKGSAGRFRVTPNRNFVLVRIPVGNEWETRYVTTLAKPLSFLEPDQVKTDQDLDIDDWAKSASPGDPYPIDDPEDEEGELRFRQKRGGVISRKVPGGEAYARVGEKAKDSAKGVDAKRLLDTLNNLRSKGAQITRIKVNERNHVLYREGGQVKFIIALRSGLEFPD